MSRPKRSRCEHESRLHRYKKFLTSNNKPIWHCVDCFSRANFDMAIVTNLARCHDCQTVFTLMLDRLHSVPDGRKLGLIDGIPITCGHPECADRQIEHSKRAYAATLADKIMQRLSMTKSEIDPESSSEAEREGEDLLKELMKEVD